MPHGTGPLGHRAISPRSTGTSISGLCETLDVEQRCSRRGLTSPNRVGAENGSAVGFAGSTPVRRPSTDRHGRGTAAGRPWSRDPHDRGGGDRLQLGLRRTGGEYLRSQYRTGRSWSGERPFLYRRVGQRALGTGDGGFGCESRERPGQSELLHRGAGLGIGQLRHQVESEIRATDRADEVVSVHPLAVGRSTVTIRRAGARPTSVAFRVGPAQ